MICQFSHQRLLLTSQASRKKKLTFAIKYQGGVVDLQGASLTFQNPLEILNQF